MKRASARKAIDRIRRDAGLPIYDKPLVGAVCEKCNRRFFWRPELVPEKCSWPGCGGKVKREAV